MQVSDVMTPGVQFIHPEQTIREAARIMAEQDIGALPVGENDRLVGMVTDRDIVIRGLADGKGPDTKVRAVMSPDVKYCYEDEKVDHVAHNMGDIQVRRLPVMNRNKRLVGIVAMADLATKRGPAVAGETIKEVSERRTERTEAQKPALMKPKPKKHAR
ncbi:MAG TPA: CBS domain-containing protein [Burkholderiales bacterium]|nr:CBS domain-containing protein [Burkholderiales bacterium]